MDLKKMAANGPWCENGDYTDRGSMYMGDNAHEHCCVCGKKASPSSPTITTTEPAPYIYTSDTTCTWDTNPNLDISMPDLLNVGCCGMAKKIIIDSSVIEIDDRAFMACLDVKEIDFSGATSLTTINKAAFFGMTNLGRVDMGVSVRRYRISAVLF